MKTPKAFIVFWVETICEVREIKHYSTYANTRFVEGVDSTGKPFDVPLEWLVIKEA
jgi:hypothetical protein